MTRTAGGKEREKYDRELAEIQPFIDTIEITAQQHNSTTAGSRVHPHIRLKFEKYDQTSKSRSHSHSQNYSGTSGHYVQSTQSIIQSTEVLYSKQ